ncbi:hypothetical protein BDW22DRAFT_1349676 [Trametopsis cervina]|nr:hypothetical protein BDW22DRAFT_1349676 [Trametopsis cervina]
MEQFLGYMRSLLRPQRPQPDPDVFDSLESWEERLSYMSSILHPSFPMQQQDDSSHSAAGHVTGADIPQEIFPEILRWISIDDRKWEVERRFDKNWTVPMLDITLIVSAPPFTLINCSLVSVYWANQCRRYMFRDKMVTIFSYQDACAFRYYATLPNSRLTPICDLVQQISVRQSGLADRSFLHLLHLRSTQGKPSFSMKFIGRAYGLLIRLRSIAGRAHEHA